MGNGRVALQHKKETRTSLCLFFSLSASVSLSLSLFVYIFVSVSLPPFFSVSSLSLYFCFSASFPLSVSLYLTGVYCCIPSLKLSLLIIRITTKIIFFLAS